MYSLSTKPRPAIIALGSVRVNTCRDFLTVLCKAFAGAIAQTCVRESVCRCANICGSCVPVGWVWGGIGHLLLQLWQDYFLSYLLTYWASGKSLFEKHQKMPVVSGIPVTNISTAQRYLLLNPGKKNYIFIVNYFLWYRVYYCNLCKFGLSSLYAPFIM